MKLIFRWLFRLLLVLLVLAVAAVLLLDTIAREAAKNWLRRRTGLEAKIARLDVSLFRPEVTAEGLVLYNSAEFGGSPLIEMPELHVEYVRGTIFSSRPHFRLVRVNLARLNIVDDRNGNANLDALAARWEGTRGETAAAKGASAAREFPRMDILNLSLGSATYRSMKQPGQVEELKMGLRNEVLTNVVSPADFTGVGVMVMMRNGITPPGRGGATNHWQYWVGRLTGTVKK